MLHEPAFKGAIEDLEKIGSIIMIAEHQMYRKREFLQAFLQCPVGLNLSPFGEISGYGTKRGVCMKLHDISKALVEAREWIKPPERMAGGHKMQVGDMDEF